MPWFSRGDRSCVGWLRWGGGVLAALGILITLPDVMLPTATGTETDRFMGRPLGPTAVLQEMHPVQRELKRKVAKGVFLVADPRLMDRNFGETVVLIIDHGQGGTLGVIINRTTTTRLSRLLPDLKELKDRTDTLYIGGPVLHEAMVMLWRSPASSPSAQPVFADVYFSPGVVPLADLLKNTHPKNAFRVYAGHAGWAPGQLEAELHRGDWRVIPADSGVIFGNDPEKVWPQMIQRSSQQLVNDHERDRPRSVQAVWLH